MRNVVVLTGSLRTIRKTMRFFRRNVLREDTDVFACVQNDTTEADEAWTAWLREEIGPALRDVTWFTLEKYPDWVAARDRQLAHLPVGHRWRDYLRYSGSMIEYFQLQLAYMKVVEHEALHGFRYRYLLRARTDSIYAKPVDFHWLRWTVAEVAERLERVRARLIEQGMDAAPVVLFRTFMATLLSDDALSNLADLRLDYVPSPIETQVPVTPEALHVYLSEGRYIQTFRKNHLYIVRRDLFHFVPTLGSFYGFLHSPVADNEWWNAEGQFRDACYYSCVSVVEYSSWNEEKSLAYYPDNVWNEADFFDENGECVSPYTLYCCVRR